MALWKRLWLLFTVIWVIVAGLNAVTIIAFSEGELERENAIVPSVLAVVVPALAYALGWILEYFKKKK